MPASLIAVPYTILEISTFLGQLLVDDDDDDDDDDENCHIQRSYINPIRQPLGRRHGVNGIIVNMHTCGAV